MLTHLAPSMLPPIRTATERVHEKALRIAKLSRAKLSNLLWGTEENQVREPTEQNVGCTVVGWKHMGYNKWQCSHWTTSHDDDDGWSIYTSSSHGYLGKLYDIYMSRKGAAAERASKKAFCMLNLMRQSNFAERRTIKRNQLKRRTAGCEH